jgi:segregation and condensation protein B
MNRILEENIGVIEGMLYLRGDEGLNIKEIQGVLNLKKEDIIIILETLEERLNIDISRGLQLVFLADKYKLATKVVYKDYYALMVAQSEITLSNAAMETLAIIAYNQPVTRLKVEDVRGVNSDAMIKRLQVKALIKEVGREESPGRPILYAVTNEFMDAFNLKSLDELPVLEEVEVKNNESESIFDIKYHEEINQ